jgi:arsenate reductase (thioredoxin)
VNDKTFRILILCTGNSARSILAESLVNHWGGGAVIGFSAGSHPKESPHPLAIERLAKHGMPIEGLRSKSWNEFTHADAPNIDLVITVCDNAANEACPIFPGSAVKAHWGIPDPASATGSDEDRRRAFEKAYRTLEQRISMLVDLPLRSLTRDELQRRVQEIAS